MREENCLTVGAAAAEIPLELPIDLAGYALRAEQARAIHDPLRVRTTVLRTPAAAIALVVLDLLYVPARVATIVRHATAEAAGVDPAAIMVTATHTHCAPADLATTDVMGAGLASASSEAARRARQRAEPARLAVAVRPIAGVSANRRYLGGKVDLDAWILVAQAASDPARTIATIVNFPCHATVLGPEWREVSADFPGVACATIERMVGGTATYLQGFAGDVNPARAGRGWPECARIGTIIGSTVAATVLQAQGLFAGLRAESPTYQAEFDVTSAAACVEVRPRLSAQWASVAVRPESGRPNPPARGARDAAVAESETWIAELLEAEPNLFGMFDPGPPDEIRIQLLTLADDLHILGMPGEPFGATAESLRRHAPGNLLTAGYANQSVGYLPPAEEWALGGYEVGCCGYAIETESALRAAAVELLGPGAR